MQLFPSLVLRVARRWPAVSEEIFFVLHSQLRQCFINLMFTHQQCHSGNCSRDKDMIKSQLSSSWKTAAELGDV